MTGLQADGKGVVEPDSVLAAWCGGFEAGNASAPRAPSKRFNRLETIAGARVRNLA